MLKRTPDFAQLVWEAVPIVGRSAPRITDYVFGKAFPETVKSAEAEGAMKLLRNGGIVEVKRVFRTAPEGNGQSDFGQIDASFKPYVQSLQRPSYFVPELEEEVLVAELICEPAYLDSARRFMRKKGVECLAEARRLDELYRVVVKDGPRTAKTVTPRANNSKGSNIGEVTQ
jgi:hypothetical protein